MRTCSDISIYCDESRQSGERYMVIGGIWVCRNIEQTVLERCRCQKAHQKSSYLREFKWTNFGKKELLVMQEFPDSFFDNMRTNKIAFRCIVVDTHQYNHRAFSDGDKELTFYKMYYQLLKHNIHNEFGRYVIVLDHKDNREAGRLSVLRDYLRYNHPGVRSVEPWKSHDSYFIQLADVLSGAIGYHWNGFHLKPDSALHKRELATYIARKIYRSDLAFCHSQKYQSANFHIWKI